MESAQSSEVHFQIIKKRARPTPRVREPSPIVDNEKAPESEEEHNLPLEELLELRRLRRARQGIDVSKLNKGEVKKRKKKSEDDGSTTTPAGLVDGGTSRRKEDEDDEEEQTAEMKARRSVRQSNFTQQTNLLDVDKHMMEYIEENMKLRRGEDNDGDPQSGPSKPYDPQEELFKLPEKYKIQNIRKAQEEGNVSNSISMLTAIPEVDLGMDTRLKNIEDTEKAKRFVADARRDSKRQHDNDEHLSTTRFYKPNQRQKSDADIMRGARLEAMGLRADDHEQLPSRQHRERNQTATDEIVMERFKKRMRK